MNNLKFSQYYKSLKNVKLPKILLKANEICLGPHFLTTRMVQKRGSFIKRSFLFLAWEKNKAYK